MFKDYDKYLSASLKVYLFVLIIVFIMKLVGLDYFGLDETNQVLIKANNLINKYQLIYLQNFITLYLTYYFYFSIVCDTKKVKLISVISTLFIIIIMQRILIIYSIEKYYVIFSSITMFLVPMIIRRKMFIFKQFKVILLMLVYQLISLVIRGQNINQIYSNSIIDFLMNFDQILMLAITYNIYFMKGERLCLQEVCLSLPKKINLKNLQVKLQRNLRNFKKLDKETKLTYIIYFIFSIIWNVLSVIIILLIAKLNHTFIECIFILTSFWLSKRIFGKAFHLKSMIQCFIVSNIIYYVLNRITTPLGISIFVPIMLGVGLSYVTSKLVKNSYKPLYRGMPKELFEETILKVVDKNSEKYKICYDFYIEKKSIIYLSMKYNYTEIGIRKIKSRINDKIKRLD